MKNTTKKTSQLRALAALTKASIISSLRNPSSLFFNFFFPFIFIVIFGMLGQSDVSYSIDLRPASVKEGPLYETLTETKIFHLNQDKSDEKINEALFKGQTPVALTITKTGEYTPAPNVVVPIYNLKIETSAADPQNAGAITSIINNIVSGFNTPQDGTYKKLVNVEQISVEGRKFEQIDFILPGQLAFAL